MAWDGEKPIKFALDFLILKNADLKYIEIIGKPGLRLKTPQQSFKFQLKSEKTVLLSSNFFAGNYNINIAEFSIFLFS